MQNNFNGPKIGLIFFTQNIIFSVTWACSCKIMPLGITPSSPPPSDY